MGLRNIVLGLVFVILSPVTFAQDIHFSQYYASPLNLNPALIGGFNGTFRLVANYRNQWFSAVGASSYVTYSGSIDAPILRQRLNTDQLGVGLVVFNDKSGDGGLSNMTVMAGASYHKSLDNFNRYSLSLGVTAGIVQRRIDFTKLTFEEQFVADVGFDPIASNNENISSSSIYYPDFIIGVLFRGGFADNVNAYVGGSLAHVHKPKESFLVPVGEANRLDPRYTAHAGVDFSLGKYVTLTPGLLYLSQSTVQEITTGLALGYKINDLNSFYFGSWFRILDKDALIFMGAYEVSGFRVGLSYDTNLSDWKEASGGVGAVEISLIYIHKQEPVQKISPVKFCPRF